MMPKGVEHDLALAWLEAWPGEVKIPMMPKGVEHRDNIRFIAQKFGENSYVAGRR